MGAETLSSCAHVGIDVFEDALGQKNQPHSKANEQDTARALRRSEEELEQ